MHDHKNGTPSGERTPTPSDADSGATPDTDPVGTDPLGTTEATRRELYDTVVEVHFQPTPEEVQQAKEDPENHVPAYTPDQAGLTVFRVFGRWFGVWRSLEETEGPEARRWTVLRIVPASAGSPHPVEFLEV